MVALGGFLFGFDTAVVSGTIGLLEEQFALTSLMEGWVVSSALVGCVAGVAGAGILSDRFGRKKILLLSAALFLVSAIGSAVATSVMFLVIIRLIGGMGVGIASMLSPMFISEFTPSHMRGRMVSLYQLAVTIGIVFAYLSNAWLVDLAQHATFLKETGILHWIVVDETWRVMFGAEAIPAFFFFLFLLFIPESPRWLFAQGEYGKARNILTKATGEEAAEDRIRQIKETVNKESTSLRQLFKPGLRIALLIGILLPFFQQASGINVIIYYGPKIFSEAGFTLSGSLGGQVTIGIVNVLATFIAIWKIDDFGRKPLLLTGLAGVILTLGGVGLFFAQGITQGGWLLFFFLLFIICFAFSLGPITFVIISEIFPNRIRGRAMSVATLSLWGTNALVVQFFPWLLGNAGAAVTFWIYAVICIPALLLVWKVVPETKGKSLEEIEQYWIGSKT